MQSGFIRWKRAGAQIFPGATQRSNSQPSRSMSARCPTFLGCGIIFDARTACREYSSTDQTSTQRRAAFPAPSTAGSLLHPQPIKTAHRLAGSQRLDDRDQGRYEPWSSRERTQVISQAMRVSLRQHALDIGMSTLPDRNSVVQQLHTFVGQSEQSAAPILWIGCHPH